MIQNINLLIVNQKESTLTLSFFRDINTLLYETKGGIKMILLTLLATIIIAVIIAVALPLIVGGSIVAVVFGDAIVAIVVIVIVVKLINSFKK